MQIHFSMEDLPEIPFPVVTMGSFDGVHAGHRVIISRLNSLAHEAGGASVLITFSPHPRRVLYPDTAGKNLRLINTLEEKCLVLAETGLDHLVILEFTKEFATTTSQAYVEEYLVGKLHAHIIVVGFNHFFGHNKQGDFESLYEASEKFGFKVEEIPEQEIQNETVSSTKIRKALSEGHIQRANAYLSFHFILQAVLCSSSEQGSQQKSSVYGLRIDDPNKLIPPSGAYAVSFLQDGNPAKALLRISPAEILLFPLVSMEGMENQKVSCLFHKHLYVGEGESLEDEIARVEELIY